MPKNNENVSVENNSIHTNTSNGTTSEIILNHYEKQLIRSVEDLFTSYDIGFISKVLSNSVFYITNPEASLDLDKQQLADILTDQIYLLASISEMYACYRDYYDESRKIKL